MPEGHTIHRLARELGPGHTIVTVLCDYGTRYQSKLFNPKFLREKGLPVPPELLEQPRRGNASLRGGLVLLALGIALSLFFSGWGPGWSIGLIPGLMGAALLLSWKIENRPPG